MKIVLETPLNSISLNSLSSIKHIILIGGSTGIYVLQRNGSEGYRFNKLTSSEESYLFPYLEWRDCIVTAILNKCNVQAFESWKQAFIWASSVVFYEK